MRRTMAVVEKELEEALSAGGRVHADLAHAKMALDAEKERGHNLQLQVGELQSTIKNQNEEILDQHIIHNIIQAGALTVIKEG